MTGQPEDKRKRIDAIADSAPQSPAAVPVSSRRQENGDGSPPRKVSITSPHELISVVPYLLGYHPGRDMIIIGTWPPHGTARITLRYSLPYRADAQQAAASARHAILTLSAQQYPTAAAVFYGPDDVVKPLVARLRDEAAEHEIRFTEILRVDTRRRRYWSYLCKTRAAARLRARRTSWRPALRLPACLMAMMCYPAGRHWLPSLLRAAAKSPYR